MALIGAAFLTLWLAAPADAALRVWRPGVSGNWSDPSNWFNNAVPGPGDVANLGPTDDGHKVTLDVPMTVQAVQNGAAFDIKNSLTITGSTEVTSFTNAVVSDGSTVSFTGAGAMQGGLTLAAGTALRISGAVKWSGAVLGAGSTTIADTGDVTVEPFTSLSVGTRFQNHGRLLANALTEIVPAPDSPASTGSFEIGASGTLSLRPGPGSTFDFASGSKVIGPGRFEMSPLISGAGKARVLPGATFTPGVLGLFLAARLELEANATVGAVEFHDIRVDGGRFGAGELRATGPAESFLLGTHLGGGRTRIDGPLRIDGTASFLTDGAVLDTRGATAFTGAGIDLTAGSWENSGTLTVTGGELSGPGVLKNTGAIVKNGGTTFFGRGSLENAGGTITINAGAFGAGPPYGELTQSSGLTNVLAGATLDKLVVLNGGTLKGRGTVRGVTNNGGVIEPGASPGTLAIAGAFTQNAGGRLRMEIEGAADHDVLSVGGAASLGGTLELLGAYVPAASDQLPIVTAGTLGGAFASVTGAAAARFQLGVVGNGLALCSAAAATCGSPTPTPTATATASPTATATASPTASPVPGATASPTPSATPVPQPTAAPTATPTPTPLTAGDFVTLPAAGRCVTLLKLRLRRPAGVKIARATVTVGNRRPKTLAGSATLRLPKGRNTVKVAVKLSDGRTFTASRRYRTCAPRSRSLSSHSRSLLSPSSA